MNSTNAVLVIGDSGSGKSSAIRTLPPQETVIINVSGKVLPFKGWRNKYTVYNKETNPKGNFINVSKASDIQKAMVFVSKALPHVKFLVIDDLQYMSAFDYYDKVDQKGYDKFTKIAKDLASVIRMPSQLREDLVVFFTMHPETIVDANGKTKIKAKTLGKMIDNSLTVEGLFSIVLFSKTIKTKDARIEYVFETQTDTETTAKSPMEMFEDFQIPNSMKLVADSIFEYEN